MPEGTFLPLGRLLRAPGGDIISVQEVERTAGGYFCPFGPSLVASRCPLLLHFCRSPSLFLLSFSLACSSLFVILSQSPYFCLHCYLCHPNAPGFLLPCSISICRLLWASLSSLRSGRCEVVLSGDTPVD